MLFPIPFAPMNIGTEWLADFSSPRELLDVPRDKRSKELCRWFILRLIGLDRSIVVTCITDELRFLAISLSRTAWRIDKKEYLRCATSKFFNRCAIWNLMVSRFLMVSGS